MRTHTISNADDVIDSRDVIARIEELESELTDAFEGETLEDRGTFKEWLEEISGDNAHTLQDAANELLPLLALAEEAEGYAADWRHGETLIRDSYFERYAMELADECGMMNKSDSWPYTCIDWERAARELQYDYTSVEFGDVMYWIRS